MIETMTRIAHRAELDIDTVVVAGRTRREAWIASAVSEAAVQVARQVNAEAIVTPTHGGSTPRAVARLRPPMPVIALCDDRRTAQFLNFTWGVRPVHRHRLPSFERTLHLAARELRRLGVAREGSRYIVTAGYPPRQASNLMTVQTLGASAVDADA